MELTDKLLQTDKEYTLSDNETVFETNGTIVYAGTPICFPESGLIYPSAEFIRLQHVDDPEAKVVAENFIRARINEVKGTKIPLFTLGPVQLHINDLEGNCSGSQTDNNVFMEAQAAICFCVYKVMFYQVNKYGHLI